MTAVPRIGSSCKPHSAAAIAFALGVLCAAPVGATNQEPLAALSGAEAAVLFDPSLPFNTTGEVVIENAPIETIEGTELTAEEVGSIRSAETEQATESPNSDLPYAFATAGPIDWRGDEYSEDEDIDVELSVDAAVPDAVVDVFYEAMKEYRDYIDLDLDAPYTHRIEVGWEPMTGSALAYASTTFLLVTQEGATTRVPLFLADSLTKTNNGGSASAMRLVFNSNISWDYSSGTEIGAAGTYHLKTLFLHELGHGLGMSSGIGEPSDVPSAPKSAWTNSLYAAQDITRPFSSERLNAVLQDDLWFRNTDGTWEKAYDPTSWLTGSSLSHLDESSYPNNNSGYVSGALMTPFFTTGEASPVDGVIAGILGKLGYHTLLSPAAPSIEVSYNSGITTVQVTPTEGGGSFVPARTWEAELRDSGGQIVASSYAMAATDRIFEFSENLTEGTYQLSVIASAYDHDATAVTASLVIDASQASGGGVGNDGTQDGPTTPEAPEVTFYDDCDAVRAAGLAPMLQSHESFRSSFDTDLDGYGCELVVMIDPSEPPLDSAKPQNWYRFQIARLYSAYFGRYPDEAGWQFWNNQFVDGEELGNMSQYFSASPEFRMTYGDALSNSEFVNLVYSNVLGRAGEAEGMAFWEGRLAAGMSRGNMMIGFSESLEFVFNAGATATGTCWQADSPFDSAGVRLSYECAAGETAGVS